VPAPAYTRSPVEPWVALLLVLGELDAEVEHAALAALLGKPTAVHLVGQLFGGHPSLAGLLCELLVALEEHPGLHLRGVRAAFMNETSQASRFDEAKLKDLTGGDTLTGRFLHQEFFDFSPTHKLIIRGNHKPLISGTDEGIWRRLRLIPFIVTIPPDEQDQALVEKLHRELSGILRWAVQGCLDWQHEGLKPPPVITEALRAYREESDTLGRFIAELLGKNGRREGGCPSGAPAGSGRAARLRDVQARLVNIQARSHNGAVRGSRSDAQSCSNSLHRSCGQHPARHRFHCTYQSGEIDQKANLTSVVYGL
jgi:hypothetical protein